MDRRLIRSEEDRMLAGVCGGLGQYLGIEGTLVRLALVLFAVVGGSGILLYLVAWFLMPDAEGRRDALPLVLAVLFFVLPGACCGLSWVGGLLGSIFGALF